MVRVNLLAALNITIMGDDLESITLIEEISYEDLNVLIKKGNINYDEDKILIDLDEGLYLGTDILNLNKLKEQIKKEIKAMNKILDKIK